VKLSLITVGKLRKGPEADLIEDYLARFDRIGRNMGLGPASVIEVEDKKGGGKPAEAALLSKALPENATLVVLGLCQQNRRLARQRPSQPRLHDRRR